jgi:hypothetical protein
VTLRRDVGSLNLSKGDDEPVVPVC